MGRARQLAGRGNNHSILLDSSAADTDVGERLVLNGTDTNLSNVGFSILQEDETDNPDVEVTSFIDPNDTLIFKSCIENQNLLFYHNTVLIEGYLHLKLILDICSHRLFLLSC